VVCRRRGAWGRDRFVAESEATRSVEWTVQRVRCRRTHGARRIATVVVALALLVGCSSTRSKVTLMSVGTTDSSYLRASNQTSDGRSVVIDEVVLRGTNGYVAVHSDGRGAPSTLTLGVSGLLSPGAHRTVIVRLETPLKASTTVFLMLHRESDGNTTYDYPRRDPPMVSQTKVLTFPIQITVHR
jgi:hypothetical protein